MSKKQSKFTKNQNKWFAMVESHVYEKKRNGKKVAKGPETDMVEYLLYRELYEQELQKIKQKILEKYDK